MKKRILSGVSAIIILSMALKIYWINNVPLSPVYDFKTFYRVAVNLFEGKGFTLDGYPWAFQSYGYPLFLSLFFKLVNNSSIFTAKIFNVICSTLTLPFIYFIFNKVFKNRFVVWFCFILFAFLPNNLIYTNVIGSEVLSVLLLSIIICMNLYMKEKRKIYNFVVQGILIGILSLVKPFFMAYPIILIFIYLLKEKHWKKPLVVGVSLVSGFLLILIPSTIKNYKAFGKAFPISYNGGYTLYINNNSQNVRGTWMNAFKVPATDEFKQELADVGFIYDVDHETEKAQNLRNAYSGDIFKNEAVKWIISNPGEFFTLGCLRVVNVFFDGASDVQLWGFENLGNMTIQGNRCFKVFMGFANAIIFVISASFIFILVINIKNIFLKKTDISILITVWSMLFFYAVYFVVEGQARYNFPTLFLMIICFGWLFEAVLSGVQKQDTSEFGGNKNVKKTIREKN